MRFLLCLCLFLLPARIQAAPIPAPLLGDHKLTLPRVTYLRLESTPPGSSVYDRNYSETNPDQGMLGKTPLTLPLDRNLSHVLWVKHDGYQVDRVVVEAVTPDLEAAKSETVNVSLKPASVHAWLLAHPFWAGLPVGVLGLVLLMTHFRVRNLRGELKQAQELDAPICGRLINEYRVLKTLGEGGSAHVYLAEHATYGDRYALKLLKTEVTNPISLERFYREMALGLELRHPNLPRVWSYGTYQGRPYMVMDYVAGRTLALVQSQLTRPRLLEVFSQVCQALGALHGYGMVHRDVKPDNVMVLKDGSVRLLDFGIAKSIDMQGLTATGTALGTPLYMSPEHLNAKIVDVRSDIYSAGVMLFFLLTGQTPFRGETVMEVLGAHLHEPPPLEELPADTPPELVALLAKMLAKLPESRYSSMDEVIAALTAAQVQLC